MEQEDAPLAADGELDLLDAFRHHYFRYEAIVREATTHATDSTVLARIGDDLDEYATILAEANSNYAAGGMAC